MTAARRIEVAPERWDRWVAGFFSRHGPGTSEPGELTGGDGVVASYSTFDADPMAVLLIRRGGYAVASVSGSALVASKVGTRHVQSRTAAGGWSQQRFARRRGGQADALVGAVADHLVRVLDAGTRQHGIPAGLVAGGDRTLVRDVLADARLAPLGALPRREFYDIRDPNAAVLRQVVARARSVTVTLSE